MVYLITSFNSKSTTGKSPISPYDDNTFTFETFRTQDVFQMYQLMASQFILNIPLEISEPIRTYRRKQYLDQYFPDTINYFLLDLDDINSRASFEKVIEYFKQYKCVLGESRSFNDIDCFNLKGFIFCDLPLNMLKFALQNLQNDLIDFCTVDKASGRKACLNAPIGKVKIILDNTSSDRIVTQENISVDSPGRIYSIPKEFDYLSDVSEIKADNITDLCLKYFQNLGFEACKQNENGSISFRHSSEVKTPGGYFWFPDSPYIMHHFNPTRNINIFEFIKKLPQAKDLLEKTIDYKKEFETPVKNYNVITTNQKFLKVSPEIHDSIIKFLEANDGVYKIRAPMGTGKSEIISHIIKEASDLDMNVLIVTNRISVAEDFQKKYNIKIYNKDKYQLGDSLICQYDSLWKYMIKYFDLIILDEFISLLLHSRSSINNSSINCAKFYSCFKKKLVIADAFLPGYENKLLNKKSNCWLLDNQYRDPTKLFEYSDFNYFVLNILNCAKQNKITISSTSLSFVYSLQLLLSSHNIKTCILTSDTPQSTKDLIYKHFNDSNNDFWDVLIFSPTLTVGVSNMNKVRYHFHFDSAVTADVISSLQMIKRTRKSKEIHYYIKSKTNFTKTTLQELKDDYITNVGKHIEHNYLFELNDYGEPVLSKLGNNAIKIDVFRNILEFNHKTAFRYFLSYHFENEPNLISEKYCSNIISKYTKQNKENQTQQNKLLLEQYLTLNELEKNTIDYSDGILKKISSFDYSINENCSPKIKEEILLLALNKPNFIEQCRFYGLFYNKPQISDEFLRVLLSNAIMKNNQSIIEFLNRLISFNQTPRSEYKISEVSKEVKYFLTKCGFRVSNDVKGIRYYKIDSKVEKYFQYININQI